MPKVRIGRLFSFPPASKSSSGRLGNRSKKSRILSFTVLSSASFAAISSPRAFISLIVSATSTPCFFSCGICAETLLRCAFIASTSAMMALRCSSHFKNSVKSMSFPRFKYLSWIACASCLMRFTSIISSLPLVLFCSHSIVPQKKRKCNCLRKVVLYNVPFCIAFCCSLGNLSIVYGKSVGFCKYGFCRVGLYVGQKSVGQFVVV